MEKTSRPSSNISEIISKFAKVFKFRPFGVFPSENTDQTPHWNNPCEDIPPKPDETELVGGNFKPSKANPTSCGDLEVSELFDMISVLKLAYVELQHAHLPYDPDRIVAADELVVTQLEALYRIKRARKAKPLPKAKLDSSSCLNCLKEEIEVNESRLGKLKFQAKVKDSEVCRLQQELVDLDSENKRLTGMLRQGSLGRLKNVSSFEDAFRAASNSIHDFAKPLISLMKASRWDLDEATYSIVGKVIFSKKSDKKYAFESYIARRMFRGISLESFDLDHLMKFDDPLDALMAYPDSKFSRFCGHKYLLVVHPSMEASFFGNLDQRALVLGGRHPRTPFYQIFAKMAKWVWVLGGIAGILDLKARIFVAKRGSKFSSVHMESVEGDGEGLNLHAPSVGFMVMPGFKIRDSVIRSRVYLSAAKR